MEALGTLGSISNIAIAVATIFAAWTAYAVWRSAEDVAAVQLFVSLRQSHAEIQHRMATTRYHDDTWDPTENIDTDPKAREALRTLERYWLHTSTEWFVTTKLKKGRFGWVSKLRRSRFTHLWDNFYKNAIVGALRNRPLRIALYSMIYEEPGSTFSGNRADFALEMAKLYEKTARLRNAEIEKLKDMGSSPDAEATKPLPNMMRADYQLWLVNRHQRPASA